MFKLLSRFLFLLLIVLTFIIIYLSYFGIVTDKFDNLIKSKANEVYKQTKLEFKKTKIYLNIRGLNVAVKLQSPKILLKEKEIILTKIDLFLPLRSFITSDFLLQRAEIAFSKNDVRDLTKITDAFLPKIFSKQVKKIFSSGKLEGEFIIPFNSDGSIAKNYQIEAKLLEGNLNINKDFQIKNLFSTVKYSYKSDEKKEIDLLINKGSVLNLDLNESAIKINLNKNNKIIKSNIKSLGTLNLSEIRKISSLLGYDFNYIRDITFTSDLKTEINFSLDDRFKIREKNFSINGKIINLNLEHQEYKNIKKFLPDYDSKLILKDVNLNYNKEKKLKLSGLIKFDKNFKDFVFNHSTKKDKNFKIDGKINLSDPSLKISNLNYSKDRNTEANLDFEIDSSKFGYHIDHLLYFSEKSKIELNQIKLNKKFEIRDIKSIKVNTFSNSLENNNFQVNQDKTSKNNVLIAGKLFDAEPLLKSLYKTSDKKTLSKDFNSEIKVNFDKAITGTKDDVFNFSMIASIKKGKYNKLSLKGNFSENEIIEMTIYKVDENKKTLQVISDRARPFIKNFDFIKGFEEGKLEYESTISKDVSNSNLLISNFKVSKVPALAQLLTLASLQGIADTLNGEGIRFDSFEMKSNTKGNLMNIEDALAMGPAVSILLDGYVDKGKIVSLRGTLVPATKLNSIIASIPLVGDILVGKKTGEGVVGVSFKMKGPPKKIKTTVNPIKTLTPRFIVRAVEKMKRKKKEEAK